MYIVYKKPIPEVLALANQAATPEERSTVLKQHGCPALQEVLRSGLDPKAEFGITKIPSYKLSQMPEGHHPSNLWIEARRLYVFAKASTVPIKRQLAILTQILETMSPEESQIYEDIITRQFATKYPNLAALMTASA
jgi:hypothetical protein